MKNNTIIIGVCGRYFSGKTIVAHIISEKLDIYNTIHTDIVRQSISLLMNNPPFLTAPTYTLSEQDIKKQFDSVSETTLLISQYFRNRGESHIVEGIHFNEKLAEYLRNNGTLIYIKNDLSIEDRIMLKKVTRTKLRYKDGKYKPIDHIKNALDTYYLKYKENIEKIDKYMDNICMKYGKVIIEIEKVKHELLDYEDLRPVLSSLR